MGVRGLAKFLRAQKAYSALQRPPEVDVGATGVSGDDGGDDGGGGGLGAGTVDRELLVVDGSSLIHYARRLVWQETLAKYSKCFYFDFRWFDEKVSLLLTSLCQISEFDLMIIFDGPTEIAKLPETRKRVKDNITFLRKHLRTKLAPQDDHSSRSLHQRQLISCLKRFDERYPEVSIEIVVANGEADRYIASVCRLRNAFAVLGQDSDFFIFQVPYIPLSSLHFGPHQTYFHIYSPDVIEKQLRLPPQHLPLFAALLTNDFVNETMVAPFARRVSC
eukprot:TRINITY_DN1434_c0_g2_i1.p1 TRINITY_DN1434_c0_g2~~TRINITY_DN1434_c0_g2_i1.p1  ORF type:complete len:276 (-),score=44.86 TRINITY_DN1434_c0_g2_i1:251-1078(-)